MRAIVKTEALRRLKAIKVTAENKARLADAMAIGGVYAPYIPLMMTPDLAGPVFPMDLVTRADNRRHIRTMGWDLATESKSHPERFSKVYSGPGYPIDPKRQAERDGPTFLFQL